MVSLSDFSFRSKIFTWYSINQDREGRSGYTFRDPLNPFFSQNQGP